jgi:hypothetical protein
MATKENRQDDRRPSAHFPKRIANLKQKNVRMMVIVNEQDCVDRALATLVLEHLQKRNFKNGEGKKKREQCVVAVKYTGN